MTPNTVLVIENESATTELVERSLQNEGYTMYSAADAGSGLQTAKETVPALIMLNLAVDGANGLEICKTIHSDETLKEVPLVLLTLREGKFDPIYTKLYGIVNFLKKPFTAEELIENVREFAPFQPGVEAPRARAPIAPPMEEPLEELDDMPSFMDEQEESVEQEPEFEILEESVEEESDFGNIDLQEPAYADIDEPMEPTAAFSDVDEPMGVMSDGQVDDDVYTLDEDISLEDAQADIENSDVFETVEETPPAGNFQQNMQMVPEDDKFALEDEVFDTSEDDDMLNDIASSIPEPDFSEITDPSDDIPEEDPFDFPEDDAPAIMTESAVEENDIADGSGLSLDGMGFDEPSEPIEPLEFEMPAEEDEPAPRRGALAAAARKADKKEPRKRASSSVNRPKGGNKRPVVLLLILFPVLLLAAGASYYFFLYDSGPAHVVQVTDSNPAPGVDTEPQTVPEVPTPSAPQGDVPPPAGVNTAPESLGVPKPAEAVPAPAPVEAPKPVQPKPAPAKTTAPQVPTPKPPPPRVPAPTQTAQAGVPAGSNYTVQFGVFSTERNAQDLINRLKKKGIKSFIKPRKSSTGKFLYYVLLDDGFKTKDAASDKASEIKRRTGLDTTVHKL